MYSVSDAYKEAIKQPSRQFELSGNIRLNNGLTIDISDSNVIGELSVSTQMMSNSSTSDTIDIGAIPSAVLSMTIQDENSAEDFADARVRLLVGLKLADDSFEYVKMGIFYIDSSSIKRTKNRISFIAYDKMVFLHFLLTDDMRTNMNGMDVYGATAYLCSLCGIQMQQTQDEVLEFPNADIALSFSSQSIETARDAIMWCGQMMGCFGRINRSGKFEFVQIKAENDSSTGMIIPVREIAAKQRYSTEFADGVLRISTITMRNSNGKIIRAYLNSTGTKRSLELALEQNPLLLEQTTKTLGDALKAMLVVLKTAYFRPFKSEIANDPALDAGDYVRLRGGSIDTSRGYATGLITHSVWRYRGKQDIVNVGSTPVLSLADDDDSTQTAAVMSLAAESEDDSEESGEVSGEEMVYTQPLAQSQKAARALGGDTAKYLKTADGAATAQTYAQGLVILNEKGQVLFQLLNGTPGSGGTLQMQQDALNINTNSPYNISVNPNYIQIYSSVGNVLINANQISISTSGGLSLQVDSSGLSVNGNKIG